MTDKEYPDKIQLYDHVSNSGIVHMPGRRFPGITLQGDSMCSLLAQSLFFMQKAKEHNDEDMYYEALGMAELFKFHLEHYEEILEKQGFEKPYNFDVKGLELKKEYKEHS